MEIGTKNVPWKTTQHIFQCKKALSQLDIFWFDGDDLNVQDKYKDEYFKGLEYYLTKKNFTVQLLKDVYLNNISN